MMMIEMTPCCQCRVFDLQTAVEPLVNSTQTDRSRLLNFDLPRVPGIKVQEKSRISYCKILKNKCYHAKVLLKRFHLNGHTIGFRPQTQKLELHYMSPLSTLGAKGLKKVFNFNNCFYKEENETDILVE